MNLQQQTVHTIVTFLKTIGIAVKQQKLAKDTFLPGLSVVGNSVLIDPEQLKYPGDILHEAGHIAVTDPTTRSLIGTDNMDANWPTDGEEIAAILWSFAACKHLDLPLETVFHAAGYKGNSAWLINAFTTKNYMGLPLLAWMGLCTTEAFPKMKQWLR